MGYKYCKNCGEKVDSGVKFCPNCKSTSFRYTAEVITSNVKPSFVQSLFYWQYNGRFVMSKSKVAAIFILVIFILMSFTMPYTFAVILIGLFVSAIIFLVGFGLHIVRGWPSKAVIENNDYGFFTDLKHMLFFWQNRNTGEFVLAKTKIACFIIFGVLMFIAAEAKVASIFGAILACLVFTAPVYIVGFAVHKLTNDNPTNGKLPPQKKPKIKPEKDKKPIEESEPVVEVTSSKFEKYKDELAGMKTAYMKREGRARELIEKKFQPPQLTYNKFISVVDSSTKLFNEEADNIENIISLASEDSKRIDDELKSKFEILNSLIDKMDDLINELVLSLDSTKDDDVGGLLDDMENLIGSIKEY